MLLAPSSSFSSTVVLRWMVAAVWALEAFRLLLRQSETARTSLCHSNNRNCALALAALVPASCRSVAVATVLP
uniref:Putative secreted peptide n=1 Tax=Anopheles braziliensis TaxID=58242 RepID=A0A2M3ZS03_9DIPT